MYLIGSEKSVTALELLMSSGLDWSVRTEKLITQTSGIVSDNIAIVRDDTDAILGVHKESYQVYQNQQMAELIADLCDKANIPLHKAGMFGGGAKVYIQIKGSDLRLGSDMVEGFFTVVNSFDGSTSLGIGKATNTISCMNSFFMAYKALNAKIKHTKSMEIKVDDLLKSIESIRVEEAQHFEIIRKLAATPATDETLATVYDTMFKVKMSDLTAQRLNPKAEILSTKMVNSIDRLDASIRRELATKEKTLWGLFSGVTHYTTHTLKEKEEQKMFGSIATKEQALFNQFAKLVA